MDKSTLQAISNGLKAVQASQQSQAQNAATQAADTGNLVAINSMTPSQATSYLNNENTQLSQQESADSKAFNSIAQNQSSITQQMANAEALSNYLGQPVQAVIPALSAQPAGGYVQSTPSSGSTLAGTLAGVLLPAQQLPADQSLMSLLSASQSPLSYLNVNAQLSPSTNPTSLMSQLTSAPFAQTPNIAPPNFAQQQTVGA